MVTFPLRGLELGSHLAQSNSSAAEGKEDVDGGDAVILTRSPELSCYDAYAVINHFGTLVAGHYTATCLSPATNSWCSFNDRIVSPLVDPVESAVVTPAAYILCFARRDIGDMSSGQPSPGASGIPVDITSVFPLPSASSLCDTRLLRAAMASADAKQNAELAAAAAKAPNLGQKHATDGTSTFSTNVVRAGHGANIDQPRASSAILSHADAGNPSHGHGKGCVIA
jgi:hypothetical protein